jgi:hypothetical protein
MSSAARVSSAGATVLRTSSRPTTDRTHWPAIITYMKGGPDAYEVAAAYGSMPDEHIEALRRPAAK